MPERQYRFADLPEETQKKVTAVFEKEGKPVPEIIVVRAADVSAPRLPLGARVAVELKKKRAELEFRKANADKLVVQSHVPFYRQFTGGKNSRRRR